MMLIHKIEISKAIFSFQINFHLLISMCNAQCPLNLKKNRSKKFVTCKRMKSIGFKNKKTIYINMI